MTSVGLQETVAKARVAAPCRFWQSLRVNPKRLTLAFLAVFAGLFGTDYLIHSVWLKSDYDQASYYLWRPEP